MKRKQRSDDSSDSGAGSGSDFKPSPSPPPADVKPDVKPDIKPKATKSPKRASPSKGGGSGKLPPGSKAALASLIVQRGIACLPSHAECADIVSTLTPRAVAVLGSGRRHFATTSDGPRTAVRSDTKLTRQTGMTPAQVKNQLDPRKGVRKELLKLAENLG